MTIGPSKLRFHARLLEAHTQQRAARQGEDRGEKANDLIVADRQKHHGMSWSKFGSVALASVTALKKNKEYKKWFQEEELEFKLAS